MEYLASILQNAAPMVHFISFGLLILAGFNMPVSEDLVFIISASIAATIVPQNAVYIFIGCFLGAYCSDIIAYSLGRFLGPKLLTISFFRKNLPQERIDKIESYFEKYGSKTLFFGRFIPFGIRNVLFITSGLIKLRFIKFLIVDLIALSVTSSILFYLGYSFGNNYKVIIPYLDQYKYIIFSLFIIAILFFVIKGKIDKKNEEHA